VFRISVPANITIEPQDPAGVTENNLNNLIYDAVLDAIPETIDINNGSTNGTNSTLTSLTIDEDVRFIEIIVLLSVNRCV